MTTTSYPLGRFFLVYYIFALRSNPVQGLTGQNKIKIRFVFVLKTNIPAHTSEKR